MFLNEAVDFTELVDTNSKRHVLRFMLVGDARGTDAQRAPDVSLRALIKRNHAALLDAMIDAP